MEKRISIEMYPEPLDGISLVGGDLVKIVGEQVVEIDGKLYDQYIYDIVGYIPKNGKHFAALKPNLVVVKKVN